MTPEQEKCLRDEAACVRNCPECGLDLVALRALLAEWEELRKNGDPASYSSMVYWREHCFEARAEIERLKEENAALRKQVNDVMRRSERDHMIDADRLAAVEARLAKVRAMSAAYSVTCPGCGYQWEAGLTRIGAAARPKEGEQCS